MTHLDLLRKIHKEMNIMMRTKGDDTPSKSWHERYDFLERYRVRIKKKLMIEG